MYYGQKKARKKPDRAIRIREIISKPKGSSIKGIAKELSAFKAYQSGQQDAAEQAQKRYDHAIRMHYHQKCWWKVVHTTNGNILIWTNNSVERILIRKTGDILFEDEMDEKQANSVGYNCKKLTGNYFFGSRNEVVEKAKIGEASTDKLPPVDMF